LENLFISRDHFISAAKLLIRTEVISPLWALLATAACPALEVGKINILKRRRKRRRKHAWRILRGLVDLGVGRFLGRLDVPLKGITTPSHHNHQPIPPPP